MRFFHRLLLIGVLHVVRHPTRTLLVCGGILAVAVSLATWKLRLSTDQSKLFDPNVKFFHDYQDFNRQFPENEAIYVIIEAADVQNPPSVKRWTALADAVTRRLKSMPDRVKSVDCRIPIDQLGSQGLLFDEPQHVRANFDDMKRFIPLVKLWAEDPNALTRLLGRSPLERFLTALGTQPPNSETAAFVARLTESWNQSIREIDNPQSTGPSMPDLAGASDPSRLGYYYVTDESDPNSHLLLVRVYHRTSFTSLTAISETVDAIRNAVADEARAFPDFHVGLTGRPALEADEMRTTDRDSHSSEILALTAVFAGLALMLRSLRLALFGEIALGVGIGWTFGWATISVGELNLLSIVFLLALIGIGMDYLVQVLTRYRQEATRRSHPDTIWIGVFRHVAPPINTACLGAAGAFFVAVFTHFRGAAELGIIAGGGLLLCLISGYVVLPPLLTLFPPRLRRGDALPDLGPPAQGGARSLLPVAGWILVLVAGIPLMLRTHFDPGLLNLQAPNLESVKLVRKLQTWSAVVVSRDPEILRAVREAVQVSPEVSSTESILTAHDNLAWLQAHQAELPPIEWTEPQQIVPGELETLSRKSRALAERLAGTTASEALAAFSELLRDASGSRAEQIATRLSGWQSAFVEQLKTLVAPFHPEPLNLNQLPPELLSHFIGVDGIFALYIYPKHDLWDQKKLAEFVNDIESKVSPIHGGYTLTGIALNIFHSTSAIEGSFYHATVYALLLILFLVFIDLRRVSHTLLAVSVLALGLPMLTAAMGLLGVDWNFANFFGLPILVGAGHEYGVFLLHRYREALHDPRRVWRRWDVSDRALLLCAYVTCTSFGFFWALAHHRGLRSLGLVMALGTACIYLSAVLVLRPLLLWRLSRMRQSAEMSVASRELSQRQIVDRK